MSFSNDVLVAKLYLAPRSSCTEGFGTITTIIIKSKLNVVSWFCIWYFKS